MQTDIFKQCTPISKNLLAHLKFHVISLKSCTFFIFFVRKKKFLSMYAIYILKLGFVDVKTKLLFGVQPFLRA